VAELELLASGFGIIEGPTVDAAGNLYFSDVSKGGVYRRDRSGTIETVIPKRKGVGGLCLHVDGGVVVAGRDVSHVNNGETRILLTRENAAAFGGQGMVGGFNDLCADDRGRILVGTVRLDEQGNRLEGELLLVSGEGDARLLYDGVDGCNGIALNLADDIYHCASVAREVIVSRFTSENDVEILHRLSTGAVGGMPDGLKLDVDGQYWIAFYRGGCVARFAPDGTLTQRIAVPAHEVTSLCFAGADNRDLFIVTEDNIDDPSLGGCIYRTRVDVAGVPVKLASIGARTVLGMRVCYSVPGARD